MVDKFKNTESERLAFPPAGFEQATKDKKIEYLLKRIEELEVENDFLKTQFLGLYGALKKIIQDDDVEEEAGC